MTTDEHLEELIRQCMNQTALNRLSMGEARGLFAWLLDGHMIRTGLTLDRPRPAPRIIARDASGEPIYAAGANFSTHETVEMK